MERRGKRLASSSVSQSKGSPIEYSDRISSLPDEIAHHILSFLGMIDIARLNIVSKRWQELCISIPSFTLDGISYRYNLDKQSHLTNFLVRFMRRRSGMKISHFCLRWNIKNCIEEYRVLTWLNDVLRSNVEVLDLELNKITKKAFPMPLDIFRCESLRFLSINLKYKILQLPSRNVFSKLQSLSLKYVAIFDQLFGENVISSCKFLERLCLEFIFGLQNINIMSSSLKYLEVRNSGCLFHLNVLADLLQELVIYWRFSSSSGRSLKVAAPHLKSLTWGGLAPDNYFFGNLKNLQYLGWSLVPNSCQQRNPYLVDFSCSIEGIKDLSVHAHCLKALYSGDLLPISLNSLRTLDVYFSSFDGLDDEIVPAIASLLKGLPNVQNLCIRYWDNPGIKTFTGEKVRGLLASKRSGFRAKYWESQDLIFIHQLKRVKMELKWIEIERVKMELRWVDTELKWTDNIVELLKYILKHATALEVMDLFYPPSWRSRQSDITVKLNQFKIAPTTKIYLHPKSSNLFQMA